MANTTRIGTTTEGVILAALLKAGKTVLIPFGNQLDYDLANNQAKKIRWAVDFEI